MLKLSLGLCVLCMLCIAINSCVEREQERNMEEYTNGEIQLKTWAGDVQGRFKVKRTQHETTVTEYTFKPPRIVQWATEAATIGLGGTGIGAGILGLYAAWSQRRKREKHAGNKDSEIVEQLENSKRQMGEVVSAINKFMKESESATLERLKLALKAETSKDTRMLIAELK